MRLALLISGGGTTAASIVSAIREGRLWGVEPACVVASRAGIPGIDLLQSVGVAFDQVAVINPRTFEVPEEFGEAMMAFFRKHGVDFVGQYGWLAHTPENVLSVYHDRIINQHPAPLDPVSNLDFGGKGMYGRRAVYARMRFVQEVGRDFWTEATAHRVVVDYDQGALVKTAQVPILPGDTLSSLYERLLPVEYAVQIAALQDFANGSVTQLARAQPLIRPGEESILDACKREAMELYPHG